MEINSVSDNKKSTGIPGLDDILNGGLIAARSYLLLGSPGTGKTILSLQWLLDGIKNNEKCLYITLAERYEEIAENAKVFEWDIKNIEFLDLSPNKKISNEDLQEYQVFSPCEVEQFEVWDQIYKKIMDVKPTRLIIDSLTHLRYLSLDEYQFRKHILSLVAFLNSNGITSLLLFEPIELEKETSVSLAVNGIFHLSLDVSKNRAIELRAIQVQKLRGSGFLSGYHPYHINSNGIEIFPHYIEKCIPNSHGNKLLTFGIQALDSLLKGGIDSGTTTIFSGPGGVGKSSLGTQFLINGAQQGEKSLLITFEESSSSLIHRSHGMNMPIEKMINKGVFSVMHLNPMELSPDQFFIMIRDMVEKEHYSMVMIDSLRGYNLAMEEYGTLISHIHNVLAYLNGKGVTTILINEIENITGNLKITDIGISHLADNVLLLRYAELESKVIKLICCLKKRLSDFSAELRTINYTAKGIIIGEALNDIQGILTGTPTFRGKDS